MTDETTGTGGGDELDPTRPRFTDKRRVDPETGAVREPAAAPEAAPHAAPHVDHAALGAAPELVELEAAQAVAAERLDDLQRLQAEYVNYRKRVERDRLVARDQTVYAVVESLLGVLDDVDLARQHGELADGPFAAIADKLEAALGRFGWERYGAVGEPFDPNHHEALMHALSPDVDQATVMQVLQPGHRVGERIVRAARVAVAEPGE
ncbi:nucleotide exchange factor GrpE [Actinotalea sp.]|uniref:nucleotide exchange factor GrpE n=1 Tax=Actinotalea sp. TaxID=1872145 RepID=UPI002CBFFF40|nr:nucleotide exchange factor GrpE [Actinotalea sp.]HQY32503.1 nucleotide exchange factor GrpE [Actinotalea sp.]HRA51170.1 nucleotide exchange factor GrpE [Actinotalea sp.]